MRHKRIPGKIKLFLLYGRGFYCTLQQLMPCTPTIDAVHYNNIYPALKQYSPSTPNKTSSRPIISCSRSLNEESIWAGRNKGAPPMKKKEEPQMWWEGRKNQSAWSAPTSMPFHAFWLVQGTAGADQKGSSADSPRGRKAAVQRYRLPVLI